MFMCFIIYFIVFSSYSNFIAAHGVDIHTWARVEVDGIDTKKDVVDQRTLWLYTEFHFFLI